MASRFAQKSLLVGLSRPRSGRQIQNRER